MRRQSCLTTFQKQQKTDFVRSPFSVSALPIFPARLQASIFGAGELNCRVRNGNGWTLTAISTDYSIPQNLASMDKPTRCLSMETKKQRRERAFTLAWKRAIRSLLLSGDPYESRTRVCGVRGRRLNHLTNGPCRRSKLRIFRFHLAAKTPSLHCFSSSNQTRLRWALIGVLSVFGFPLGCITHPSGSGTPSGTRTLDTLIKSQVLYQLS